MYIYVIIKKIIKRTDDMRILKTSPSEDGFMMPAEFSRHSGCIMIFPHRRDSWQNGAYAARKAFAEVINIISLSEKVTVCARYEDYDSARKMLPEREYFPKGSVLRYLTLSLPCITG